MLKEYKWRGSTWQFEEGRAPADAVPVAAEKAAKAPRNKAAAPRQSKATADKVGER